MSDQGRDLSKRTELIRAVVEAAQKRVRGEPVEDPLLNGLLELLVAQGRQTDPQLDERKLLENISRIPLGGELGGLLAALDKKRQG